MLFMSIYTFEPGQRKEVIKRRLTMGTEAPEGLKIIGEWIYLGGLKGFLLFEANDPKVVMGMTVGWTDLMKFETIPVMRAEEALELARSLN
jgi:hypothetical protein